MRPRILVDVDGPLTDGFFVAVCDALQALEIDAWPHQIRQWNIAKAFGLSPIQEELMWRKLKRPGVAATFAPRAGAYNFLSTLRQDADVYAVTSPLDGAPTWAHDREEWLAEQLGFDKRRVISVRDKAVIKGDMLIDDKPEHLWAWSYLNLHPSAAVLWRMPHNETSKWAGIAVSGFGDFDGVLDATRAWREESYKLKEKY